MIMIALNCKVQYKQHERFPCILDQWTLHLEPPSCELAEALHELSKIASNFWFSDIENKLLRIDSVVQNPIFLTAAKFVDLVLCSHAWVNFILLTNK